jgi:hypothetical protein
MDERTAEAVMATPPHLPTTTGSELQRHVEDMFMWAFSKAAEVHLNRRMNKAFSDAKRRRMQSPEGLALTQLQYMVKLVAQLAKAGIKSRVLTGRNVVGISIMHGGVSHRCMTVREIDDVLTAINATNAKKGG